MYIVTSIFLLFIGSIIISKFFKEEYKIKSDKNILKVIKRPGMTIQFNLILIFILNIVISLSLNENNELEGTSSLLVVIFVSLIVCLFSTLITFNYIKKKNTTIDFNQETINQKSKSIAFNDLKNLELNEYTRGNSSSYELHSVLDNGSKIEIIRAKKDKRILELISYFKTHTSITILKTSPEGLLGEKTIRMN